MLEDVDGTSDGRETVRRSRELCMEHREKPALERGKVALIWDATAMACPETASDSAVGNVRHLGPVDGAAVDVERLADGAEVAFVVDCVRGGESAIDIENREAVRIRTPLSEEHLFQCAGGRRRSVPTVVHARLLPHAELSIADAHIPEATSAHLARRPILGHESVGFLLRRYTLSCEAAARPRAGLRAGRAGHRPHDSSAGQNTGAEREGAREEERAPNPS